MNPLIETGENMKKWIVFSVVLIIIVCVGVTGYQFAVSFAATKMVEQVQEEFLTEDVVTELKEDPYVRELTNQLEIEDMQAVDKENLPFSTKEEGLKVVMSKFSVSELKDIALEARGGLSEDEQIELYEKYKDRFTEEEWQALLVIGLAELNK